MILFRQKIFYEKQQYYTKLQRIKEALKYALAAGLSGAGFGATLGMMFRGFKGVGTGAAIGGGLGALGGAQFGWEITSNKYVDAENKRRKQQEDLFKEVEKDPSILFKDLLDDQKLIREFRQLENKYKIEFPSELYKLIKVRKLFVPTLIEWYKKYKDPNYMPLIYAIIPSVTKADLDFREEQGITGSVTLLIDPEMADDTFITYRPEAIKKKFGGDILFDGEEGDYTTLKEAVLDRIDGISSYSKPHQKELLKKYEQFIASKL